MEQQAEVPENSEQNQGVEAQWRYRDVPKYSCKNAGWILYRRILDLKLII